MRISTSKKFIAIANPRCASTTVRRMVDPYSDISGGPKSKLNHHASMRQIESYLEDIGYNVDDFSVFTTVRNPWDRAVSIYHYGLKNPSSVWHKPAHTAGSFGAFLHCDVLSQRFRPAAHQKLLPFGTYDIDTFCRTRDGRLVATVFKFEELHKLPIWLNKKFDIKCELIHTNEADRKEYRLYYNGDSRDRVAWLFESDIKIFGYEF